MADKTVSIGVNNNKKLKITCKHVTEVKVTEELESDTTATFDGPVVRGSDNPSYTIDISKLDLDSMDRYVLMRNILKALRNNYGTITVSEVVRPKGEGAYKLTSHYNNVLLASNEHTLSAEDLTAAELSFSGESVTDESPKRI